MGVYWAMFVLAALLALGPVRVVPRQMRVVWFVCGAILAILLGLRDQVGGDWYSYLAHFYRVQTIDLGTILFRQPDPGYYGLNWIVAWFGGSVHLVNLACAILLVTGTVLFARAQPRPWLAVLVAIPYLLIVVGMGYTRQAAAIGLVMIGLVALGRSRVAWFVFWVLAATTFHRSAVLVLPIAALASTKHRLWTTLWIGVAAAIGVWLFVFDSSEQVWAHYVVSEYADASEGGGIRVAMNTVPAVLLLLFHRRLTEPGSERKLWLWMSVFSLACIPLLAVSATAVDRIALYFIPIQLFVFPRLPRLAATPPSRTLVVLAVIGYYALVQFVWLNYASHAGAWLPYAFMPLD
jgi:hypothetical protein